MKITKKALNKNCQKNVCVGKVCVDKMSYTPEQIQRLYEEGLVHHLLGADVIFIQDIDKIDVAYSHGCFCIVAILKKLEKRFLSLHKPP